MSTHCRIVCVAVPTPLSRTFDYILPDSVADSSDGQGLVGRRVVVPFGRGQKVGVVVGRVEQSALPVSKLKGVSEILDSAPSLPADILHLLRWASTYYQCPIGEAVATALPAILRGVRDSETPMLGRPQHWRATESGRGLDLSTLSRARVQRQIMQFLQSHTVGDASALSEFGSSWRVALKKLIEQGFVEACDHAPDVKVSDVSDALPELNGEQSAAMEVLQSRKGFNVFLLDGVTGSGKTEIYLRKAAGIVVQGKQVLVIVPEIGLTPQLVARFQARFGNAVVALHSGLNDTERLRGWRAAASGQAPVVVGTRSSVFVPLQSPGLIVVDEEHDTSLKQQDGFRYHARDLALVRAREAGIPVILGSATPSLESLHNVALKKYTHIVLSQRAGGAQPPNVRLLDITRAPVTDGLSALLIDQMRAHLDRGQQVMVYLNRRGYAPVMLCDECAAVVDCTRCDAHMTYHARSKRMRCHHCGYEQVAPSRCSTCGHSELSLAGEGTERIEYALRDTFADKRIVRIDRDTTRRKGALEDQLALGRSGQADILIGTQMLAKGHHFPGVTLVAMLDVDRSLFSVDFRASEVMAQTIVQVAGRSGRAAHAGEVVIQTRHPTNALYQTLLNRGYRRYAEVVLAERRAMLLPPFNPMALLRAEATTQSSPKAFLQHVRDVLSGWQIRDVQILGPASAPLERLAGRYRAQLLLSAKTRKGLHSTVSKLRHELESMKEARKVRWSLDVDPLDLM
ncbi:MAG: primosomal protein N' [Pseudomonadota bacterium]